MSRPFYLEHPEVFSAPVQVVDAYPGRVRLSENLFFPGGGGQLSDRGAIHSAIGEHTVAGFHTDDNGHVWHLLADNAELAAGEAEARVDTRFRQLMRELHTDLHIINALVYQRFNQALVTGAQMNDDGTARIDFDLQDANMDALRELEAAVNDAIKQNFAVQQTYVSEQEAQSVPGLIRSRSVAPPPSLDGMVRIVEIVGLDRQACGGTHLASTAASRALKILKIDNKGKHNRRLRIGLVE